MSVDKVSQEDQVARAPGNKEAAQEAVLLHIDQKPAEHGLAGLQTEPKTQFEEHLDVPLHHHADQPSTAPELPSMALPEKDKLEPHSPHANANDQVVPTSSIQTMENGAEVSLAGALEEQYDELAEFFRLSEDEQHKKQKGDFEGQNQLSQAIERMVNILKPDALSNETAEARSEESLSESLPHPVDAAEDDDVIELPDLYALIESKPTQVRDKAISSLALAKSLQHIKNPRDIDDTLSDLSRKLSIDIGTTLGHDIALRRSYKDHSGVAAVRTSFKIAGEIQRHLSAKVRILLRKDQMQVAVDLLEMAETGEWTAIHLLNEWVKWKNIRPKRLAKLCNILRSFIADMPIAWWPEDKMEERLELLSQLNQLSIGAQSKVLGKKIKAEENLEKHLRTELDHGASSNAGSGQ